MQKHLGLRIWVKGLGGGGLPPTSLPCAAMRVRNLDPRSPKTHVTSKQETQTLALNSI